MLAVLRHAERQNPTSSLSDLGFAVTEEPQSNHTQHDHQTEREKDPGFTGGTVLPTDGFYTCFKGEHCITDYNMHSV